MHPRTYYNPEYTDKILHVSLDVRIINEQYFGSYTEQPLVLAVEAASPSCALELIKHGADVNAMTRHQSDYEVTCYHWHLKDKGEAVLDLVRERIQGLRLWELETAEAPVLKECGLDEALSEFREGTWEHAAIKTAVNRTKKNNEWKLEEHEEEKVRIAAGLEETQMKQAAIDSAIATLEYLEREVLAEGGKKFLELYLDFKYTTRPHAEGKRAQESAGFKFRFHVHGVGDLTEKRRTDYVEV